jgi:protein-tyrosine phosphatase
MSAAAEAPRPLRLQGAPNFRDLGGLPTADGRQVRHGLLYRSQGLSALTGSDLALLDGLGLRLACDLRSHGERRLHPSRWGGERLEFDIVADVRGGGRSLTEVLREQPDERGAEQMMLAVYRALPRAFESVLPRLCRRLLAADGLPAVIHCTAGKDRTGFAAAMLLGMLGVTAEAIEADYLRSLQMIDRLSLETSTAQVMALFMGCEPEPAAMRAITTVRPEYLRAAFEAIETGYGSLQAYLGEACGLDDGCRAALRQRLLAA